MGYKEIQECRICHSSSLLPIIDLGNHVLTGRFPDREEEVPVTPIQLVRCGVCGLVQLKHSASPNEMFGEDYGYRSSLNSSMVEHLRTIYNYIRNLNVLESNDIIVDIGSNDATFLNFFTSNDYQLLGIDPSAINFLKQYRNSKVITDYFSADNYKKVFPTQRAKIVSSIACFYDLEDPIQFAKEVSSILTDDGLWVVEAAYLPFILNNLCFDGCCAEHLSYYSLTDIQNIANKAGLHIHDVSFNMTNGGSMLVTIGKLPLATYDRHIQQLYLEFEKAYLTKEKFLDFKNRIIIFKTQFLDLLTSLKGYGYKVGALGASTKFNVVLQYCGIGSDLIEEIGDVNPIKYGKITPGTNIPIKPEDEVLATADYLVVGPYHFRQNFIQQDKIQDYILRGGHLIFPLPVIEVYPSARAL